MGESRWWLGPGDREAFRQAQTPAGIVARQRQAAAALAHPHPHTQILKKYSDHEVNVYERNAAPGPAQLNIAPDGKEAVKLDA